MRVLDTGCIFFGEGDNLFNLLPLCCSRSLYFNQHINMACKGPLFLGLPPRRLFRNPTRLRWWQWSRPRRWQARWNPSLEEPFQPSLLNESLDLVLQLDTILRIMSIVTMTILAGIAMLRLKEHPSRQRPLCSYVYQYLLLRCIQTHVCGKTLRGESLHPLRGDLLLWFLGRLLD